MEKQELEQLLAAVAAGEVSPDEAVSKMRTTPFSDLGFAKVDHHRGIRQGVPEIIYGEGKTPDQIAGIIADMLGAGQERVLITRLAPEAAVQVEQLLSEGLTFADGEPGDADGGSGDADGGSGDEVPELPVFTYYDLPRVATVGEAPEPTGIGRIVVATGGTSDIAVAEEAAITAEMLGNEVVRLYDVGVAGLHRLLAHVDELAEARVVVAVAGMEGALPSVIGGLVSCPVIAVPTSIGYGASFGGIAALLSMLNSCSSGISVVNIDNGFGAGYQASLINHVN
ncbi:MAG: nickel pincer cofactor biosynthesis protein LarB [Eggerthellaceae bacterium]|nr:nickel pincer cofactor biosynthesis protein LarB [Eggerthellaceae bacterium]